MRTSFETHDRQAGWEFLNAAYGTDLHLEGPPGRVRHARLDGGLVSIDEVAIEADFSYRADRLATFTVIEVTHGWADYRRDDGDDHVAVGEVSVVAGADQGFAGVAAGDLELRAVNLDFALIDDVVAAVRGPEAPATLHLHAYRPPDSGAAARWRRAVDYVTHELESHDSTPAHPLLSGALQRLLAQHALATFPSDLAAPDTAAARRRDRRDASSLRSLRVALAFMESELDRDISITDIAAAARVTPRALQYAFRQAFGTSPMRYLQQIRLDQAHHDLRGRAGSDATVSEVAARWGFYNLGRFAARYHEQFGELPSDTLHRARSEAPGG